MREVRVLADEEPLRPSAGLTARLVSRLTEAIEGGAFAAGDRLPTEAGLMKAYGVSRTVVREAVAALRAAGLVITRQGLGAFVTTQRPSRPFSVDAQELTSLPDVLQVLELRAALEVDAAGLAAERRDAAHLEAIVAALEAFEADVRRGEIAVESDLLLHLRIAEAAGNAYFPRLLRTLGGALIPRARIRARLADDRLRASYLAQIRAEHHLIVAAVRRRDAGAARRAMRRHLAGARYRAMAEVPDGHEPSLERRLTPSLPA